jgi:hypothetical protein
VILYPAYHSISLWVVSWDDSPHRGSVGPVNMYNQRPWSGRGPLPPTSVVIVSWCSSQTDLGDQRQAWKRQFWGWALGLPLQNLHFYSSTIPAVTRFLTLAWATASGSSRGIAEACRSLLRTVKTCTNLTFFW